MSVPCTQNGSSEQNFTEQKEKFKALTEGAAGSGIKFWSAMYIPIVVAMAARQDVAGATEGGLLALVAGVAAVVVSFALVPVLSRIGSSAAGNED